MLDLDAPDPHTCYRTVDYTSDQRNTKIQHQINTENQPPPPSTNNPFRSLPLAITGISPSDGPHAARPTGTTQVGASSPGMSMLANVADTCRLPTFLPLGEDFYTTEISRKVDLTRILFSEFQV